MMPTSVRPADVMCTRILDEHPVHDGDERQHQYGRAPPAPLPLLLLFGYRWLGLRLDRRRLRRCRRGRGGRPLLPYFPPPGAPPLCGARPVVRRRPKKREVAGAGGDAPREGRPPPF